MKKLKIGVLAAVAVVGAGAFAQGTVSLSPLGVAGNAEQQPAASDADDTVKVKGRGVGATKVEALKDAYRDAVEQAVGMFVDAEQLMKNDELVKDQILTHSNAYVLDCRELEEKPIGGGLVQLRILATVKKAALTKKLSGVMPTQTIALNDTGLRNVHAQLVTKEKRAEDAAALLKNALNGINPMKSLMVASIRPETQKILTSDTVQMNNQPLSANQVLLRYLFEVKFDRAKYFDEFVPDIKKVLDQISLTPPKELRLMEAMLVFPGESLHFRQLKAFLGGESRLSWNDDSSALSGDGGSLVSGLPLFADPIHVYCISWQGKNWVWRFGRDEYRSKTAGGLSARVDLLGGDFQNEMFKPKDKVYFALITSLNDACSSGKVTMYELDKLVIPVLNEWRKGLIDANHNTQKTTNYNIILLDKSGEELGVYPWQIPNGVLMNVKFAEIPNAGMVYAAPFVGCFGENLIQWRDFVLEKDQLAKIASVKIELAD